MEVLGDKAKIEKVLSIGVSTGHYVSLKKVTERIGPPTKEQEIMEHFQDEALSERLAQMSGAPYESCLQLENLGQVYSLAPAEGNILQYILQDDDFEVLAFPDFFPSGIGGYHTKEKRKVRLTRKRYTNQRLLNVDGRFSRNIEYIFATDYICKLEQVKAAKRIALKMSKGKTLDGKKLTAKSLMNEDAIDRLRRSDRAWTCLNKIRPSPPWMTEKKYEGFAMVKQLGIPTWFMTLSAADLRWPEFLLPVARQYGLQYTEEDIIALTWSQKAELIKNNPVTAIRMFHYRLEQFSAKFLKSSANPIGKITDEMLKIEFQGRGSPHNHGLIWCSDAPKFDENDEDNDKEVCDFIDKYVSGCIPKGNDERSRRLRNLVETLQVHKHSSYCRRNGRCRFGKPDPPSKVTLITRKPSGDDEKKLKSAQKLLQKVMTYLLIDPDMEFEELLYRAETNEEEYFNALQIGASGHRIILKRDPEDVYVNPYNPDVLINWEANVDIQYVLDPYSCVQYLMDYMMKSEKAMGELLKRVSKEMKDESIAKQMEVIGAKFLGTREVCVQNAVMDCLSLWLFKKSRETVFVSGEPKESRVSMMKPKYELEAMEDEDENVFYISIHDKYEARPDSMEDVCLASFATDYRYTTSTGDPDNDNIDSLPPVDSAEDSEEEEPALKRKNSQGSGLKTTWAL